MRPEEAARRAHPLVKRMRAIRRHHHKKLVDVEHCMDVPEDSLRQMENGRQRLPGLQERPGMDIGQWIQKWLKCVGATETEREQVEELLTQMVLGRWKDDLPPDGGREPDGGGRGHR